MANCRRREQRNADPSGVAESVVEDAVRRSDVVILLAGPDLLRRQAEQIEAIAVPERLEHPVWNGMDSQICSHQSSRHSAVLAWLAAFGLSCFASSRSIGATTRARFSESETFAWLRPGSLDVGEFDHPEHRKTGHADRDDAAEPTGEESPDEHPERQAQPLGAHLPHQRDDRC